MNSNINKNINIPTTAQGYNHTGSLNGEVLPRRLVSKAVSRSDEFCATMKLRHQMQLLNILVFELYKTHYLFLD